MSSLKYRSLDCEHISQETLSYIATSLNPLYGYGGKGWVSVQD